MNASRDYLRKLAADVRGAVAIEYSLIAALIVIVLIPSLTSLGLGIMGWWGRVEAAL